MSVQIVSTPIYAIMDASRTYFVSFVQNNYYGDNTVEVSITPATSENALQSAFKSSQISALGEQLHKLNVAGQINALRWRSVAPQEIKQFVIVKATLSTEIDIITEEKVMIEMDAERMRQKSARQEKINRLLQKLDASKVSDNDVYNIENILSYIN